MAVVSQPYRTSTDLVDAALMKLGVLSSGQPTDPEDFGIVENALDGIFRMLASLEIVYVPDPEHIPGEWFEPLAAIVSGQCAEYFGSNPDHYAQLKAAGLGGIPGVQIGAGSAAMALKIMTRGKYTGEPLKTLSF